MGGFSLMPQKRKGPFDAEAVLKAMRKPYAMYGDDSDVNARTPEKEGPFISAPDPDQSLDSGSTFELGNPDAHEKKVEEIVGPPAPTALSRLQEEKYAMEHPARRSRKSRILEAISMGAPTLLGGIFGGSAGAAGAAEGTVQSISERGALQEGRRGQLREEIEAEKNRQERLQEHTMATDAQKATLIAENARAAGTLKESKRYHDLLAGGREKGTAASLRSKGFTYDDEGNIIPVRREDLSPREQAELDLKESSNDLATARTEVERLKNNPDSLQYQLAVKKLEAQKERTGVALQRLGLSKDIFERETFGTVGGKGIPGGPVDEGGKPIGLKGFMATRPTSAARSKAEQGQVVVEEGQKLKREILAAGSAIFGPTSGRISNLEVGIGSADPQVRELFTHLKSFAALQPALHGSRGIGMQKEFEVAAGKLQDNPEAAMAAIESLMGTAKSFIKVGGVSTPNRGPGVAPPLANAGGNSVNYNGKTYTFPNKLAADRFKEEVGVK
jgi:hypothetical protein